jgi:hypothetical protein
MAVREESLKACKAPHSQQSATLHPESALTRITKAAIDHWSNR